MTYSFGKILATLAGLSGLALAEGEKDTLADFDRLMKKASGPEITVGARLSRAPSLASEAKQGRRFEPLFLSVAAPTNALNPYDSTEGRLDAIFQAPSGGKILQPCFWDDGDAPSWRLRFTPKETGTYIWCLVYTRGSEELVSRRLETVVAPGTNRGFIRRSEEQVQAFRFDNGERYKPFGMNIAWGSEGKRGLPGLDRLAYLLAFHENMASCGMNWARMWMAGFANMHLDWAMRGERVGRLEPRIARFWDALVASAEAKSLPIQLVLQHHGQGSSTVNPNWKDHPWNAANGGFLTNAAALFTDGRALRMTRDKYRYCVARWGYSPAILAWELWNEVQYCDAWKSAPETVAAWHRDMAAFLRLIDGHGHLITTSSIVETDAPIWDSMDYLQNHTYAVDIVPAIQEFHVPIPKLSKPIFYGEYGAEDEPADSPRNPAILWSGLFSGAAGFAMYWNWEKVQAANLWTSYLRMHEALDRLGMLKDDSRPVPVGVVGGKRTPVVLQAGATAFMAPACPPVVLSEDGSVKVEGKIPLYLHGDASKRGQGAASAVQFRLPAAKAGQFHMALGDVANMGSVLVVKAGVVELLRRKLEATDKNTNLVVEVPAGTAEVSVCAEAADWVAVKRWRFSACTRPSGAALGRLSRLGLLAWAWNRNLFADKEPDDVGPVRLESALPPGMYRVRLLDPVAVSWSEPRRAQVGADGTWAWEIPTLKTHCAVLVVRE